MKPYTMYDAMLRGFFLLSIAGFTYTVYCCGIWNGVRKMQRSNPYVKKRVVKEGNILKYPFGEAGREAHAPSDCNRPQQSGEAPETA